MNARSFHRPFPTPAPALASLLAALLAGAGCDGGAGDDSFGGDGTGGGFGLAPPAVLMQSRAVDRSRLEPRVTIVDGPTIPMAREGDRWRGTVEVLPGRDYTLAIVWIEEVTSGERLRELPLATLERVVTVGPDGALFTIGADQYVTEGEALDVDRDGRSNLAEREANTDPFGDGGALDDPPSTTAGEPDPTGADPEEGSPPGETPLDGEATGEAPIAEGPLDPAPDGRLPDGEDDTPEPGADAIVDAGSTGELPVEDEPDVEETPDPTSDDDGLAVEPPSRVDVDVIVPRIAADDAPVIDGRGVGGDTNGLRGGEWADAIAFDTAGRRLFIDNLMIDQGTDESDGQALRAWSAVHDGRYLYVLVVVDDDGRRVRDSEDDSEIWRDDSLEVYVDGDNSKNSTYDDGDDDDSSRLIPLLARGTTRQGTTEGLVRAFLSVDAPIRIDFATGPGLGPDGLRRPGFERQDVYELRIDLESAGIVPGRPFGFDLQVNDDDDGGDREAKWGWAHPSGGDFTYLDPSFMGTALLE